MRALALLFSILFTTAATAIPITYAFTGTTTYTYDTTGVLNGDTAMYGYFTYDPEINLTAPPSAYGIYNEQLLSYRVVTEGQTLTMGVPYPGSGMQHSHFFDGHVTLFDEIPAAATGPGFDRGHFELDFSDNAFADGVAGPLPLDKLILAKFYFGGGHVHNPITGTDDSFALAGIIDRIFLAQSSDVPEPKSASLLLLAGVALIGFRKFGRSRKPNAQH